MYRIGASLSGYGFFSLMSWLPIWHLAEASGARMFFGYFLIVCLLVFGVFMVSGERNDFRIVPFAISFVAGCLISFGFGYGLSMLMIGGLGAAYLSFVMLAGA